MTVRFDDNGDLVVRKLSSRQLTVLDAAVGDLETFRALLEQHEQSGTVTLWVTSWGYNALCEYEMLDEVEAGYEENYLEYFLKLPWALEMSVRVCTVYFGGPAQLEWHVYRGIKNGVVLGSEPTNLPAATLELYRTLRQDNIDSGLLLTQAEVLDMAQKLGAA